MKKYIKLLLISIIFITINVKAYTKSELQDYVVSTGLSYYYNALYTDYERYSMNANKKLDTYFSWVTYNLSPEDVSRSRYYTSACAGFTASVYMYSLGYDFSEYSKYATYGSGSLTSEQYKNFYLNQGYATDTSFYSKIASNNESIAVHYHAGILDTKTMTYTETEEEKYEEIKRIRDMLEPGDIFVSRKKKISNGVMSTAGHAMLYIGDALNNKKGFLHFSGYDFTINADGSITIGDDRSYYIIHNDVHYLALKWDSLDDIVGTIDENKKTYTPGTRLYVETDTGTKTLRSFDYAILRPIKKFCSGDSCSISTINKNSKARSELKKLKVEQYVKSTREISYDYNSVNVGNDLKYELVLKYVDTNYNNLKVVAKIPNNSTYVSCSNTCSYDKASSTVTWSNIKITSSKKTATFEIVVKPTKEGVIEFEGYKVKNLQLSKIKTAVNPTISGSAATKLLNNYESVKPKRNDKLEYIKSLYSDLYKIDLKSFDISTIKSAIFDSSNKRRLVTDSIYSNIEFKNIDTMLIPGMYGGRKVDANTRSDRAKYLRTNFLEVGDVVITWKGTSYNAFVFIGLINGKSTFASYDTVNQIVTTYNSASAITGYRLFKEIFAYDYFVILRPSRVYGNTIIYEDNGTIITSYFTGSIYGELSELEKDGCNFLGWYKDAQYNESIKNSDSVTNSHKIYAKWNCEVPVQETKPPIIDIPPEIVETDTDGIIDDILYSDDTDEANTESDYVEYIITTPRSAIDEEILNKHYIIRIEDDSELDNVSNYTTEDINVKFNNKYNLNSNKNMSNNTVDIYSIGILVCVIGIGVVLFYKFIKK